MEFLLKDYRKYKWFYTLSGKLVIGGKSAEQNDLLLSKVKETKKELFVMHTSAPGSPFSVILSEIDKVTKSDLEETAVFTACFSKAWKSAVKKAKVDIFLSSNLYKSKSMKSGTWGVKEKLDSIDAELKLALTIQDNLLRAVPVKSTKKSVILISPGKIDKLQLVNKIHMELEGNIPEEQILSALPSGGIKISR